MIIGQRIKFFREDVGLTQHQLAELAGISREAIGNYENGRRVPPVDIAQRIATALKMSVDDLIYPDNMKPKKRVYSEVDEFSDEDIQELSRTLDARNAILSALIKNFDMMNDDGKRKAAEHVSDLAKIPEYQKAP